MSSICLSTLNNAVKDLQLCFNKILDALAYFESSTNEKPLIRSEICSWSSSKFSVLEILSCKQYGR